METTEGVAAATEFGEYHARVFKVTHNFLDSRELKGRQAKAIFKSGDELYLRLGPNSKALR